MRGKALVPAWLVAGSLAAAGEVRFSSRPSARRVRGKVEIAFAVSKATDVEVAVLDSRGRVVRHLAAGVLDGKRPPPEPLKPGLRQRLEWDLDDFGKPARGGPFKIRVRAGMGAKFGRMIGQNPLAMGKITGVAADAEGSVYLMSISSGTGNFKQIVALDPEGDYLRTVLPFPANLPAERLTPWARHDGAPRPVNQNGLGPEFYTNRGLTLLSQADEKGLLFTDGASLYRVALDGGNVEGRFKHGELWPPKKKLPNTGGGPTHLAPSPDGNCLYLSGPYSSKTAYGHKFDPRFPPGQVYRMECGKGTMQPFVKLPTIGHNPAKAGQGWNSKHISHPGNYTVPHGPVHDVAVDKDGNVLVADQDGQRVAAFSPEGKPVGEIKVGWPDLLAVHPKTGAVYVQTKRIMGYWKYKKKLLKYSGWKDGKLVAELDFGVDKAATPRMSLAAGEKKTVLWISGMRGGLVQVEDKGKELVLAGNLSEKTKGPVLGNADKISVDGETETVYVGNAWADYLRFSGLTGELLGPVKLDKGLSATDLVVGPRGYIYAQLGKSFSGPLCRYTRDLKPAPYKETGTHVLSKYIYGRMHGQGGLCEKGMAASRDGKLYVYWMFGGWVKYAVSAWGPDGKPINGSYSPIDQGHYKRGTPGALRTAVIGPLPGAGGGVRVDSRGRIYVGLGVHPPGHGPPPGFEKDRAYARLVGSVVRFGPEGGAWGSAKRGQKGWLTPEPKPEGALEMKGGNYFVGADLAYPGFAPMSGHHLDTGSFGNVSFCVCRVPRFDIDLHDRLYIPNAVTNSVRVVDCEGNLVLEFGSYGNFDSRGPGDESPIKEPEIPLGWPTGAGASDEHIYVGDMYNRRVVRLDRTFAAEETCEVR